MINFFPYKCFASPWHTNPFPFTGESVFILFSHYSQFCHLQQKNKTLRFSLPRSKSYHASVCCRASAVRKVMKEIVKFVDRIFLENLTQWRCGWIHFLYFFFQLSEVQGEMLFWTSFRYADWFYFRCFGFWTRSDSKILLSSQRSALSYCR